MKITGRSLTRLRRSGKSSQEIPSRFDVWFSRDSWRQNTQCRRCSVVITGMAKIEKTQASSSAHSAFGKVLREPTLAVYTSGAVTIWMIIREADARRLICLLRERVYTVVCLLMVQLHQEPAVVHLQRRHAHIDMLFLCMS